MDEKLIVSVFKYPVLYDATLVEYRCMDSRIIAWKNVSTLVGQPVDDCKRKWKNLRDHFIKELRKEVRSKSQGELVSSRWKYRQQLNYLAPFCTPRRRVPDLDQDRDRQRAPAGAEAETKPSDKADVLPVAKIPDVRSQSQVAFVYQLVSPGTRMPQSPQSVRNGGHNRPPSPAKWAKKEKGPSLDSDRSRDEDELFLLSFVPALKRLAPQKRYQTKLKIQQIMYEAEFNVEQPESNHTNLPETQD
ncbi:uncharacterized protein LOC133490159 isoform X1 [Phyllopteryx taeniolatus]|uniref:uncharacterized protein LOC133490159 isoform X1 n=1 Tax=Phyllopteryx taeniolatus TaxID=161469 RepID=UPI002AD295F2|nr:uncharacterized protein LOC133490159 isoform X1 [Phyllopteryx taeniolatus]